VTSDHELHRRTAAIVLTAALLMCPRTVLAEEVTVPVGLQASFLAKVAPYDRSFVARAGTTVQILLVTKPNNADSVHVAAQMRTGLSRIAAIGGLPHEEVVVPYPGPSALAYLCRSNRIAIIFFAPGFADDIMAIREALAGVDVLTAAAVPAYVAAGIVLGFDVVSGRPKLTIQRPQARRQNVDFTPEVLKLMKVYE
jgi:hypothetical protein